MTQEELAGRAGLAAKNISDLERGERKRPYPHTVRSLADALKLPEDERAALFAAVPKRGGGNRAVQAVAVEPTLPMPPTPLVGRERDLQEVNAYLAQPEVRLLTLTGTGGVGKTRLAIEVARDTSHLFPEGVTFVTLAALGDATLVLPTVVKVLGLGEVRGKTPAKILQTFLREKKFLLVLDNFEHVMGAAPEVAELIRSCLNLSVLVTSRAPLRIRGEQEYPVRPLALPASTRSPDPEGVLASASGRLFVERARAVSPAFALTPEDAAAVASICWRLAGIPLALELTAARVKFLSPRSLLKRLDQALSTGWARDLPERQETMRSTLDWSYGLLSEPAQSLFRRLSVFVGGFALEAAEAVGATEETGSDDVIDLLGSLVEQSLVTSNPGAGGEVRYGMLEPIRQYALEKLEESGEAVKIRRRHATFFLELAERAEPELRGPQQVEWLQQLERENDNLREAMSWALSAEDGNTAARLAWALWLFWWLHGYTREGRRWMEALLDHDLPPKAHAIALAVAGTLAYAQEDYAAAKRYFQAGLEPAGEVGDKLRFAHMVHGLGLLALNSADLKTAKSRLEEALRLHLEAGRNDQSVSTARTQLGTVLFLQGDQGGAVPMFQEGLAIARRSGDRPSAYVALYNLAQVALSRRDYRGATDLLKEGVVLSEQVGDRAQLAHFLEGLAAVGGMRGDAERSARLFGAAEVLLEEVGARVYNYYVPDHSLQERAEAEARAALGDAAFEEARERGRAMTFEQAVEYALEDNPSPE